MAISSPRSAPAAPTPANISAGEATAAPCRCTTHAHTMTVNAQNPGGAHETSTADTASTRSLLVRTSHEHDGTMTMMRNTPHITRRSIVGSPSTRTCSRAS